MVFNFFGRKKNDDKTVTELPVADIVPNRFQPRKVFQEDAIKELAETIKDHGLLQPIVVREYDPGKYEIIAGERRFRAVTSQLNWDKIPAIVTKMADDESAAMAIVENLQRAQLSPVEEARAYSDLMKANSMTQETLARRIGKSQSFVANKLRLLKLSEDVQTAIMNGAITERHGRELLKLTPKQQSDVLHRIARDNLTVKETAQLVRGIIDPEGVARDEAAHAEMAARINAEVAADQPQVAAKPAAPAKKKPAKRRTMPLTKDTRLAVNTIKKSVKMVRETGMTIHIKEDDDQKVHRIIIEIPNEK